jgi:L-iditol 2-dehydrogenase
MLAARLTAPCTLQVENIPEPAEPGPGEVLLDIGAVGICGSDLHMYESFSSGGKPFPAPPILGHEFGGTILALGEDARDGEDQPLHVGQRVAVEPAIPCWRCEMCEAGHANLCLNVRFSGQYPDPGALQERFVTLARNCFPIPDTISDDSAALLETLGVAIHSINLAKIKLMDSVVVLGCGPVGLLILRLAKLAGAHPIYAFDKFPWRAEKAKAWGATAAWTLDDGDPLEHITEATKGRGVDIAIEAAWADESVNLAADMTAVGGRLVIVGISVHDELTLKHSTARRKGLTIKLVRRMKHTYPRAIEMVNAGLVNLDDLVSHRFPLAEVDKAFGLNFAYAEGVHKIMIDV